MDPKKCPELQKMIAEIDEKHNGDLVFRFNVSNNGDWVAVAKDFPGMITGGNLYEDNQKDIRKKIADVAFTYFGVPPEYCDDKILIEENKTILNRNQSFKLATR